METGAVYDGIDDITLAITGDDGIGLDVIDGIGDDVDVVVVQRREPVVRQQQALAADLVVGNQFLALDRVLDLTRDPARLPAPEFEQAAEAREGDRAAFILPVDHRAIDTIECRQLVEQRSEEHTSKLQSLMHITYAAI